MKVIVGLGNPGSAYLATRHNIGWVVLECLAGRHQISLRARARRRLRVVATYGDYQDGLQAVRLIKPQTMMNRSGDALVGWLSATAPSDLLLVCDDVNLPLGQLRLRGQGGSGGHHGLQSCLDALKTEQVARVRLGVGGARPGADLTDFVLSAFTVAERPAVDQMTQRAVEACEVWVREGIERAMNQYNTTMDR